MNSLNANSSAKINISRDNYDIHGDIQYELKAKELENKDQNSNKNFEYSVKLNISLNGSAHFDCLTSRIKKLKKLLDELDETMNPSAAKSALPTQ
jgi:hypothetical protein